MDMVLGVWERAGDSLLIGFYTGRWIGMGGCMYSTEREREKYRERERDTCVRDLYCSLALD